MWGVWGRGRDVGVEREKERDMGMMMESLSFFLSLFLHVSLCVCGVCGVCAMCSNDGMGM